jgi:hypothetical protein
VEKVTTNVDSVHWIAGIGELEVISLLHLDIVAGEDTGSCTDYSRPGDWLDMNRGSG